MARFQFFVSRTGQKALPCIATIPGPDDLPKYKGGKVSVQTPAGEKTVDLSPALTLIVAAMTVELQNGVRDFLFPVAKNGAKPGPKRPTGFVAEEPTGK